MLLALLVWVQVFAPFVHAHAGVAHTSGWHVHTSPSVHGTARIAETAPSIPDLAREARVRPAPDGPDSEAIGIAAGVPQSRLVAAAAPANAADTAGPLATQPPKQTPFNERASRPTGYTVAPIASVTHRPGLPALAHAPPVLS